MGNIRVFRLSARKIPSKSGMFKFSYETFSQGHYIILTMTLRAFVIILIWAYWGLQNASSMFHVTTYIISKAPSRD